MVDGLTCYAPRNKECNDYSITYTPTQPSGTGSCVRVDPKEINNLYCFNCQKRDCPFGETDDLHTTACKFGREDPNGGWYQPSNYGPDNNYRWCAKCKKCPEGYDTLDFEMAEGYLDKVFSPDFGVFCYRFYSNLPISCPAGYTYTRCKEIYCRVGTAMSQNLVQQTSGINTSSCYRCKYGSDSLSRPYYLFCDDITNYGPIN